MKIVKRSLLVVALLCRMANAQTEDGEMQQILAMSLEELMTTTVTISTSTKQTLSKAPSVVSVITADDIKATGATDLMDVLQGVPGVYVRRNQFGFKPLISMRGAAGTSSLLMINGEPMKDLVWSPAIFWKGVPANAIERIEIIRGPGSALYGADAASGVINVVTKTAAKGVLESETGGRVGSFDSQSGWIQHGTQWNGFDIDLILNASHTDGHSPYITADNQTFRDAADGTNVSYAPGRARYGWDGLDLRFSIARDYWKLLFDHTRHDSIEVGLNGYSALDPRTQGSDSQTSLALLYRNPEFAKDWGLNAELRYRDMDYSSGDGFLERPPGFNCTNVNRYCNGGTAGIYLNGLINQMRSAERRTSGEISGLYSGFNDHAIRLGGGAVRQDLYRAQHLVNFGIGPDGVTPIPLNSPLVDISGTRYAFAPERARTTRYLFLQDVWRLPNNLELTAGIRYDHDSDFGGAWTPRVALVWQSSDRLTTKLLYGEAFRAPTFLELYADTAATDPNPQLKPERSSTLELSFSYSASRDLKFGLSLFDFRQTNLIGLDSASKYQNSGRQQTYGIELETHWQAARNLRLSANISSQRSQQLDLIQRPVPDQQAYMRADWAFKPKWNWNLQANWTGSRRLAATDSRRLGSQTLIDTTIRYYYGSEWEFAASIRNLLDKDALEYTGTTIPGFLPLPGRSAFMEARYKF